MKQNTPEWENFRKNKIGASDAPIIMEKSPWSTPYQLWGRKLDLLPEQNQNLAMKRGHDLEDQARLELENLTGQLFLPQVRVHDSMPWMMASLDAVDIENTTICEIKCPKNQADHDQALAGEIPDKYFPQLQHQLEVCQMDMGYYLSYDGRRGALVKIYRDDKYIKKMIEKEKIFWELLQSKTPPPFTDRDYVPLEGAEWERQASEWKEINEAIKKLEKKEEELRQGLIDLARNQSVIGSGVRLTRYFKKGSVDYSAIPELKEVDLEKYRKSAIEAYRISAA
jgi:putative phage-type endonuclease